jgi:hypothetical protein
MKIKLTDFALRHFDSKFGGTKILNYTPEEFEGRIIELTSNVTIEDFNGLSYKRIVGLGNTTITDGYAPFCKYLAIRNFTKARVGSLPITLENYQYIRSGYSARKEGELPIFSRWLELPIKPPTAEWLVLVLYSHEQLVHEAALNISATGIQEEVPDCDYGIVAILGQSHPNGADPMKPETMIRNAGYNTKEYQERAVKKIKQLYVDLNACESGLEDISDEDIMEILSLQGMLTGGSGVPFSTEEYLRSVEFWEKNVTIK